MTRDGSAVLPALTPCMSSAAPAIELSGAPAFVFDEVYAAHVGFVWRIVRAFGVPDAAIEDVVQEVFVIVHRRLPEFEHRAAITTWLFAIARRVASGYRRRSDKRTEGLAGRVTDVADERAGAGDPFAEASRAQAAATVLAILEQLDDDKRVVFALVELEQLSVPEVARMLDLKLNTAYSRLRLARRAFEAAVKARQKP